MGVSSSVDRGRQRGTAAVHRGTPHLGQHAARCERVLPRGDRLTRSVQESLTNIAGS